MAAPVVDLALAVGAGVFVVKNRPRETIRDPGGATIEGFRRLVGVLGGLGTVSGLIGVHRVQACRDFAETISAADTTALGSSRSFGAGAVIDSPLPLRTSGSRR